MRSAPSHEGLLIHMFALVIVLGSIAMAAFVYATMLLPKLHALLGGLGG